MFKRRVKSDYSLARRQERECIYRCLTCPSGCPPTNINFCSFALCTITLNRSSLLHLDIRFKYKVVSSRLTFYVEKSVFTRSLLPPPSEFTSHFLSSATRWKHGAQSGRLSWEGSSDTKRGPTLRKGLGNFGTCLTRSARFWSGCDSRSRCQNEAPPLSVQQSSVDLSLDLWVP